MSTKSVVLKEEQALDIVRKKSITRYESKNNKPKYASIYSLDLKQNLVGDYSCCGHAP